MTKSATQAMSYEKTPFKKSKVRTKLTKEIETSDLNKHSTFRIICHLYRRHDTGIWIVLTTLSWAVSFYAYFN